MFELLLLPSFLSFEVARETQSPYEAFDQMLAQPWRPGDWAPSLVRTVTLKDLRTEGIAGGLAKYSGWPDHKGPRVKLFSS